MWAEFGKSTIRQESTFNAFGRSVCGRECIIIRQKSCSTFESGNVRECVMTWTGYKERDELMVDAKPT
jgi:uncharacterized protein YqfB (UPF0267 family)